MALNSITMEAAAATTTIITKGIRSNSSNNPLHTTISLREGLVDQPLLMITVSIRKHTLVLLEQVPECTITEEQVDRNAWKHPLILIQHILVRSDNSKTIIWCNN